jgi:hypothetical protein
MQTFFFSLYEKTSKKGKGRGYFHSGLFTFSLAFTLFRPVFVHSLFVCILSVSSLRSCARGKVNSTDTGATNIFVLFLFSHLFFLHYESFPNKRTELSFHSRTTQTYTRYFTHPFSKHFCFPFSLYYE